MKERLTASRLEVLCSTDLGCKSSGYWPLQPVLPLLPQTPDVYKILFSTQHQLTGYFVLFGGPFSVNPMHENQTIKNIHI